MSPRNPNRPSWTKAEPIEHGLIQSYIGPDLKVIDMRSFFGALVQDLERAHEEGRKDQQCARSISFRKPDDTFALPFGDLKISSLK